MQKVCLTAFRFFGTKSDGAMTSCYQQSFSSGALLVARSYSPFLFSPFEAKVSRIDPSRI